MLLLDLALPPDRPFATDHCGTCTRCLEACPTGALAPFRLDPSLCLTTYTVESEAEPPAAGAAGPGRDRVGGGLRPLPGGLPLEPAPLWGDPALWGGPSPLHTQPAARARMGVGRWQPLTRGTALRRVRHRHWLATLDRILGSVLGPVRGIIKFL